MVSQNAVDFFNLYSMSIIGVENHNLDSVRREWTSPGYDLDTSTRVVLSPEGEWIGFVEVWDADDPPVQVYLWGCVHPEYQRRGVGTSMVQKLISKLSHQRRNRILLEVRETNLSAQLFFREEGFRAISVLRDFYDDTTEDAYLMQYLYEAVPTEVGMPVNRITRLAG